MPFAPATLAEDANQCYIGVNGADDTARFMTITFDCTDWMKENCSGVVHIDGTARPQLVRKEDNPSYYRIIEEYKRLTGLGTIINTSFNIMKTLLYVHLSMLFEHLVLGILITWPLEIIL